MAGRKKNTSAVPEKKIDINQASVEELTSLDRIGLRRAESIVEARKRLGGFSCVDDLCKVNGISSEWLESNKPILGCLASNSRSLRRSRQLAGSFSSSSSVTDASDSREDQFGEISTAPICTNQTLFSPSTTTSNTLSSSLFTPSSTSTSPVSSSPTVFHILKSKCEPSTSKSRSSSGSLRLHRTSDLPINHAEYTSEGSCSVDSSSSSTSSSFDRSEQKELLVSKEHSLQNDSEEKMTLQDPQKVTSPRVQAESSNNIAVYSSEIWKSPNNLESAENRARGNDDVFVNIEGVDNNCGVSTPNSYQSMGLMHSLRSRIPIPISNHKEKSIMKRKPQVGWEEDEETTPGKKVCRSSNELVSPDAALRTPNLSILNLNYPRKKIPSKNNPPPELAQWLHTFQNWSNPERCLALDEMIELCEPTQVRHIMQVIEPQFQRDFISLLPKELALHVLSFLGPKDLLRAAQTCRYWRVLTEDNLLWRKKCNEEGIDESLVFGYSVRRRSQGMLRSPCKTLYMRQHQIEQYWRCGKIRPPKLLKGHEDHVITCLEFCGSKIVSGSDDNTLKVWSALTGKCLRTLFGHTGGVWASQMADNIIISGSTDRTLKVWNAETGQCIHTLYGHTSTVRCMHLHEKKVVSGSRDATLRVWDIDTGQCLHVLMGHVAAVRCVQYDGRRVVSGAYDYTVKVWDPETEVCLHSLQGHTNRVYSLQFDGTHIVSGSLDTSIRVWDVETGTCLHTLIGHQSLTSGMELKENILVSGNADSTVKVWDIRTGRCLQTLQGPNRHQSAVTCLQFSKKFVITSSDDGTVKIWDLKTGEFLRNLVTLESGGSGGVVWRVRCTNTKLICAVGSRNGTEETKLMVFDFDVDDRKQPV